MVSDDGDKVELLGVDLVAAASQDESEDYLGRAGSGHAKPRAVGCGPWYQALATHWLPKGLTGDQQQYGEGCGKSQRTGNPKVGYGVVRPWPSAG